MAEYLLVRSLQMSQGFIRLQKVQQSMIGMLFYLEEECIELLMRQNQLEF